VGGESAGAVNIVRKLGSGPNFVKASATIGGRSGGLGRLPAGLPCGVKGLLVVQRLSKPAVLPGVRGVIVARRCLLVMPGCR
jgi:hypothetical protein